MQVRPPGDKTTENVWDKLLAAAAVIEEALKLDCGYVVYTGSYAEAEMFRNAVIEAMHVRSG